MYAALGARTSASRVSAGSAAPTAEPHAHVGTDDLAFSGTNPQHLRLMMPHGSGETKTSELSRTRVLISIFYSNPEKLEVLWEGVCAGLSSTPSSLRPTLPSLSRPSTAVPSSSSHQVRPATRGAHDRVQLVQQLVESALHTV